ncbi:MAG: hypothetical protein ABSB79_02920 [Syntrophales bacterium]|jgi:hypothetical protein
MKQIEPTYRHIANETIFYSNRIHTDPSNPPIDISTTDLDNLCKRVKHRLIELLSANSLTTQEIIRPEIYKHDISFGFLPHFKRGDIHLIFKSFENIRILKNAYNICVVSWHLDAINVESPNSVPLANHYRMLSLLDEIWVLSKPQKEILNRYGFFNVHLVSEDSNNEEISFSKIIERILNIKRMSSE